MSGVSANSTGVSAATPTTVIPIATQVPRCSAEAGEWPRGRTSNAPTIDPPIPTAAISSGKTSSSGRKSSPAKVKPA